MVLQKHNIFEIVEFIKTDIKAISFKNACIIRRVAQTTYDYSLEYLTEQKTLEIN